MSTLKERYDLARDLTKVDRSRGQTDASYEAWRRQLAEDLKEVNACRSLWRTVLERAVDDLRFLQRYAEKGRLRKYEEERLRRIRENPPGDFVRGPWFEMICHYLQVNPDRIRAAILKTEGESPTA